MFNFPTPFPMTPQFFTPNWNPAWNQNWGTPWNSTPSCCPAGFSSSNGFPASFSQSWSNPWTQTPWSNTWMNHWSNTWQNPWNGWTPSWNNFQWNGMWANAGWNPQWNSALFPFWNTTSMTNGFPAWHQQMIWNTQPQQTFATAPQFWQQQYASQPQSFNPQWQHAANTLGGAWGMFPGSNLPYQNYFNTSLFGAGNHAPFQYTSNATFNPNHSPNQGTTQTPFNGFTPNTMNTLCTNGTPGTGFNPAWNNAGTFPHGASFMQPGTFPQGWATPLGAPTTFNNGNTPQPIPCENVEPTSKRNGVNTRSVA